MTESAKKNKQLTLQEYNKIKEKTARSKTKLTLPLAVKLCFLIPVAYLAFAVLYFVFKLRFLSEH